MPLSNARVLITGATGSLGSALARQLTTAGAAVLLAGRDAGRLSALQAELGEGAAHIGADLTETAGIAAIVAAARDFRVNVLINNAGIGGFGLLEQQDWPTLEGILATNLQAPLHLVHALLPTLKAAPQALIVNIGSTFGSLPFPGFAAYSAAKAGLRAFSQALRRELADSTVGVIHLSPRAIDTPLNSAAVNRLNQALNSRTDSPEAVAAQIVEAIRRGRGDRHFGFPERLFAWLNGVAPSLIDRALAGQLPIVKQHANER